MSTLADTTRETDDSGFRLTGWKVLAIMVTCFGIVFAVNGYMVHVALSTFRGQTTEHPYERGLSYNAEIEKARAQAARDWSVSAHVERDAAGIAHVAVEARDEAGKPLAGLAMKAHFGAPADMKLDREIALVEETPGVYVGDLPLAASHWDLTLVADRDGARVFHSKNRILVR